MPLYIGPRRSLIKPPPLVVPAGGAGWALIDSTLKQGQNTFTTDAIDITGADLLIQITTGFMGDGTFSQGILSDSSSNSYTHRTIYNQSGSGGVRVSYKQAPAGGAGFTSTLTGSGLYASLVTVALSGSAASPYDVENGSNAGAVTSTQPGSVTPEANVLLLAALCEAAVITGLSIDSSFNLIESSPGAGGTYYGIGVAIFFPAAGAVNPTFSWTTSSEAQASLTSFKGA